MAKMFEKFMNWLGYMEEEYEDEFAAAEEVEAPPRQRRHLVGLPNPNASMRVVVVEPSNFDEVQQVADHLKERRPVIVNLEAAPVELARRIVDFLSGTVYALDGGLERIGEAIFLMVPSNVSVEANGFTGVREPLPWERE
ncbi:MAG: cell division protein SepF [Firmicutes bacterium]|jgi:cell division inhibitor SepF|nr:cell division protein SepF [Bacillota bacterium]HOB21443.1 cell division protein SepF [Bacillota bacterium]HQD40038.1 cell division protein SepF [Bacillota bacterium]